MPRILLLALLVGAPTLARADVVFLKHGGKIEGRIVELTDSRVEVDIGVGSLTFPRSTVDSIERGRSTLDEYEDRVAALAEDDRDGWMALGRWASGVGFGTQSLRAYEHVLTLDPSDPEANRALGRVEVEGRWMTEDEAYRARGYVWFEGRWVTPAEQAGIVSAREADRAAAEAQARSAEAEARKAEAQAREAEAKAKRRSYGYGVPLYWNYWGPGPQTWPESRIWADTGRPQSWRTEGQ